MNLFADKKPRFLFSFLLLLSFSTYVGAQTLDVSGKVTSAEDGQAIPGANVVVEGTAIGATTDFDGNYSIQAPSGDAVLVFSYIGFATQEVDVNNRQVINVTLSEDVQQLDDVVVVGYSTQSRATVTSAVTKITGEAIEDIPTNTVSSVLQGKLPGVNIAIDGSAQPGNDLGITIRGGSSINRSSDPLIIVDGFPRSLSDINPQDIASVDVLKDAASAAIYGARASNGVVLVTTKRGKTGKPKLAIDYSSGFQQPTHKMDFLDATQFLTLARTYYPRSSDFDPARMIGKEGYGTGNDENDLYSTRLLQSGESVPAGYKSIPDPHTGGTLIFEDNDLQDALFRNGFQTNAHVSLNGGTENVKYSVGVGLTDQEGIAINTGWERYSGSVKLDVKATDRLTVKTGVDYTLSNTKSYLDERAEFVRAMSSPPTMRLFDTQGNPTRGWSGLGSNPYFTASVRDFDQGETNLTLALGLDWNVVNNLHFKVNSNYFERTETDDFFEEANQSYSSRIAFANRDKYTGSQLEMLLDYKKTFADKHNFNALLGYSYLNNRGDLVGVAAQGAASDNIPTLNAAATSKDFFSYRYDESLLSQFGQLFYNYDFKYLLTASIRRDGSSRFGANNRYGYFPSVSAGWVISKESFVDDEGFLSNLKLRASYGQTGNNDFGNIGIGSQTVNNVSNVGIRSIPNSYLSQGVFSTGFNYGGNAGISATAVPNEDLKWERTNQYDIGIDLGLFKGRKLQITADYWVKQTEDLLFDVDLPFETGFNSVQQNIGEVKYSGFDLGIDATIINSKNLTWTAFFNIGTLNNEIIKLPFRDGIAKNRIGGILDEDGTGVGGLAEGERIDNFTAFVKDFIIDTQAQADAALPDDLAKGYDWTDQTIVPGRKFPGDVEWIDRDGDGRITTQDQEVVGHSMPDFNGGFGTTINYKGLALTVFLDFAAGHSILDQGRAWTNVFAARNTNATSDVLDAWEQPGDAAIKEFPRVGFRDNVDNQNWWRLSTISTHKADYIALRDVRLTYTAQPNLIQTLGLSSASIYVAGNTLAYFTDYKGYSPEFGGFRTAFSSGGYYPAGRTFVFGIKVGL